MILTLNLVLLLGHGKCFSETSKRLLIKNPINPAIGILFAIPDGR
jgi:hypothetical protein